MKTLLENPKTTAFRVDGVENVINTTGQMPKEGHDWLPVYKLNLIERYKKGEVYLACRIFLRGQNAQFDLLISVIPDGSDGQTKRSGRTTQRELCAEYHRATPYAEERMFVGVVDCVECPEGIISSSVWLERSKERPDFLGEVFGPTFHVVFKIGDGARKGEHALADTRPVDSIGNSNGMTSVIEGSPKMMGGFDSEMLDNIRQWLVEPELVNFMLRTIRVRLYDKGVWLGCEESARFDFDVFNVLICANDF